MSTAAHDTRDPDPAPLDTTPTGVKAPKWFKQLAAQIGELTGEDIADVMIRHGAESMRREYRERTGAFANALDGEGR